VLEPACGGGARPEPDTGIEELSKLSAAELATTRMPPRGTKEPGAAGTDDGGSNRIAVEVHARELECSRKLHRRGEGEGEIRELSGRIEARGGDVSPDRGES